MSASGTACDGEPVSPQVADEFLKGVLTEAAAKVHEEAVPDVMAMLRKGGQCPAECAWHLFDGDDGRRLAGGSRAALAGQCSAGGHACSSTRAVQSAPGAVGEVPLPRCCACGASAGEVAASTPWFGEYRAEFFRMLLFNDHETFDHPLACAPPHRCPPPCGRKPPRRGSHCRGLCRFS